MNLQWLQSDEAEKISADAKAKAWSSYRDGGFDVFFFEKIRSNRTISITTIHRMVFTFLRSHFKSI